MDNDKIKKAKRINALRFLFIGLLGRKNINLRALGYFLLLIIAIAWIPDGLFQILDSLMDLILKGCLKILELLTSFFNMLLEHKEIPTAGIFKLIISLGLLWYLYRQIESYVSPGKIAVVEQEPAPVSKVLILFLSSLPINKPNLNDINENQSKTNIEDETKGKKAPSYTKEGTEKAYQTKNSIEELMNFFETSERPNSWEIPFTAIKHHQPELEKIVVFTSCNTKNSKGREIFGSERDYDLFEKMIKKFYADKPFAKSISKAGEAIDFEDVEKVFKQIDQIYVQLKKEGYKERDIIIDITSGQKPNSIAGALTTIFNDLKYQYVSTNSKKVISYDMVWVDED